MDEVAITEIAIFRFNGIKVEDHLVTLLNPLKRIQPFVSRLTGITNKMVQKAPVFSHIYQQINQITKGCTIVAHGVSFDYAILRKEFGRVGFDYQRKTLCTVSLSKKLLPEKDSYSLGKLTKSMGITIDHRHRAEGDAKATLELFKILLANGG